MKDIPIPQRMANLPRDSKGRLVPNFVHKPPDGDPDFRIVNPRILVRCYKEDLCWVCGSKLGIHKAFVIGGMCCVNKINSEPPSHYECARYSVQVCPFLSTPRMHRRERDMPEGVTEPAGIAVYRNPGASAIWVTRSYTPFDDGRGGVLFELGAPERVEWYCEGRSATRQEVKDSIESGFPILEKIAEEDGPLAMKELEKQYKEMMQLLPVE